MTAQQRRDVESLFDEIADLPDDKIEAALTHCGDSEVSAEVRRLIGLARHGSSLSVSVRQSINRLAQQLGEELPAGARVESYEIIERLGAGGMGIVYRAQQDLTKRIVALKLIKPAMLSEPLLRRFLFEVEVLGRLNHPSIARVFDAGIADTPAGRQPFFAMELVEGMPVDAWLQRADLGHLERLELFRKIAEAVGHAHGRGVVHRDLKPANILITGEGLPKVLDFGVAKAIASVGSEEFSCQGFTEPIGAIIGTLAYMAPEQVSGKPNEIDLDTDVYTLGVIGYEMLAGRRPYDVSEKSALEAAQVIGDAEPARPSRFVRQLRGDIDTVLLKALSKEKSHRYATADALARDVGQILEHQPISARPAGRIYRLRKFVRRNRMVVASTALIVLLLVAGITGTSVALIGQSRARAESDRQRSIAEHERDVAEAVVAFLNDDVLAAANPGSPGGRDVTVAQALDAASVRVADRYKSMPEIEAAVRTTLALSYSALGRRGEALPHAAAALELYRRTRGDDHPDTLNAASTYAAGLTFLGRGAEAVDLLRETTERSSRVLGEEHDITLTAMNHYANALSALGRYQEAEPVARRYFDASSHAYLPLDLQSVQAASNYGQALSSLKRWSEAEPYLVDALARADRGIGPDHPTTLIARANYISVLVNTGRADQAEPISRDLVQRTERVLGPEHPNALTAANNYARLLGALKRYDESVVIYGDILSRRRRIQGNDHPLTILAMNNLATAMGKNQHWAESEPYIREACERAAVSTDLGMSHPNTVHYAKNWARTLDELGRTSEAQTVRKRFNLPATQPATVPAAQQAHS